MHLSHSYIKQLFASFDKMRVLIIGDVMIDSYTEGVIERMSPEAPVPVLNVKKRYKRLGGAANVAVNIKALGADPIVCSVIGNGPKAKDFMQLMLSCGLDSKAIIESERRMTTIKERVICEGKQLLRIDEEDAIDMDDKNQKLLLTNIRKHIEQQETDCIILQDYNKGVLTSSVIKETIALAQSKGIPVAVDPKKNNFLAYQGVSLFKPNAKELREGLSVEAYNLEDIQAATMNLRERLHCQMVMTTLSEQGVIILNKGEQGNAIYHIPAFPRDIRDVSGAGDTVLSVAALCLASHAHPFAIAALSNLAGGLVCEKVGVVPIDKDALQAEVIKRYDPSI